jgi:hypothetical protein
MPFETRQMKVASAVMPVHFEGTQPQALAQLGLLDGSQTSLR